MNNGVPEGLEREREEIMFEDIMAENFPKFLLNINLYIHEV